MTQRPDQTFLFADISGFTALTEAHGDDEAAEWAAGFFDCTRKLLDEHGAREIKTIGDALMLRCDTASNAVCLGLAIVDGLSARVHFPAVRVGMHTGPAVERHGDFFGAAVNIAARVSGLAAGGQVLLTDATLAGLSSIDGVEVLPFGRQNLKNVRSPMEVYRALRRGATDHGRPIDPVCHMAVDINRSAGSLVHNGVAYHFCSRDCVRAFAATPEVFIGRPHSP